MPATAKSTTGTTSETATVVMYGDIVCPWATLALHRFYQARGRLGLDDAVRVDVRLFLLEDVNRHPIPKRLLDAELPVVGALAPEFGWQVWQGLPSTWPVSSLLPNEAVYAAKQQSLEASEQLDLALRQAFFCESRCISLRHVVLDVASRCERVDADVLEVALDGGIARAAMMRDYHDHREKVQGSPHFFFPDGSDVHNPGVEVHWVGDPGKGFPVVDRDDPDVYGELIRRAVTPAASAR
jgi:predicted DsbA family dithiol-disulfide isomerase